MKLFDSELKVMETLWREGPLPAGQVARILKDEIGWNRNTTYTVIKKCIAKGAIARQEPGFMCKPMVARGEIQQQEAGELADKLFEGSVPKMFAALMDSGRLSDEELDSLKRMVEELGK